MANEWTPKQSEEFTSLYNQLAGLPNYDKIKDEVNKKLFPSDETLPYESAKNSLLQILEDNSPKSGLEAKAESPTNNKAKASSASRANYFMKLAATAAGVALFAAYL